VSEVATKPYAVTQSIEIDGKLYRAGATVQLDDATAKIYRQFLAPEKSDAAPAAPEKAAEVHE
jgi:hypothetical protein